jgi:hypothetical protein
MVIRERYLFVDAAITIPVEDFKYLPEVLQVALV